MTPALKTVPPPAANDAPEWVRDHLLEALAAHEHVAFDVEEVNLEDVLVKDCTWQTRFGHVVLEGTHVDDLANLVARRAPFKMVMLQRVKKRLIVVVGKHRCAAFIKAGLSTITAYVLKDNQIPSSVRRVSARSNFGQLGETEEDRLVGALQSLLGHKNCPPDAECPQWVRKDVADFWDVGESSLTARYHRHMAEQKLKPLGYSASPLPDDTCAKIWLAARTKPGIFPLLAKYACEVRPDRARFAEVFAEVKRLSDAQANERLEGLVSPKPFLPGGDPLANGTRTDGLRPDAPTRLKKRPILALLAKLGDVSKQVAAAQKPEDMDATQEELIQASDLCSDIIRRIILVRKGKG